MEKRRFFSILLLEILIMEVELFAFLFIHELQQINDLYKITPIVIDKPPIKTSPNPSLPAPPAPGPLIFNPAALKWELAVAAAPWVKRDAHTALVFNDKLWLLGGVGGRSPDYSDNKSDVWASENGKDWRLITANVGWGKRRAHASVVFQNKMWALGGATLGAGGNIDHFLNDVWFSGDGTNWIQAVSSAPWTPRKGHAAVVFDGKIWLLGGVDSSGVTNDVWFSEDGVNWKLATANAPWPARYDLAVEVFDNKMWLSGGSSGDMGRTDLWVSSNGIDWREVGEKFNWPGRHGHCFIAFENNLWLIGGWSGFRVGFNDTWFSKDGANWKKTASDGPWTGREDLTCNIFKNKIWILGGMKTGGDRTNDVWFSDF